MRPTVFKLGTIVAMLAFAAGAAHAENAPNTPAPKHKTTQSKTYTMLDPIYATVVDRDKAVGLLFVAVGLDIPNDALREQANHSLPILRDSYVRSLMNFAATSVRAWRQPDVVVIADRLQRVTDKALGRPGARVLLAQVSMRVTR